MLVYDIEIIRAIPGREPREDGVEYCNGWDDHANMGVSVACAFDYVDMRWRVFCGDNLQEFSELCARRDVLVSFNGLGFDNKVLRASGVAIDDEKCYDLLVAIWLAAGLGPKFVYPSHAGYGLDAVCAANFGTRKSGDGARAPVQWQRGEIGSVIDYCLNDVRMTKQILDRVLTQGKLKSPKAPYGDLVIRELRHEAKNG